MFNLFYKYCLLLITPLILTTGCYNADNSRNTVVAEIGDKYLFLSDLSEIIPDGLGLEDSSLLADDYIKKWIKQELLLQKADENLTLNQKDVTKELQEYRNSLIIYRYKNELMKQRMDTSVTQEQMEEYYYNNIENFKLNNNIVKAIFIKTPEDVANQTILKQLVNDTSVTGLNELSEYCVQYAKTFDIFMENWIDFDVVKNNIPLEIEDTERFLSRNNLIEMRDSVYYYLVSIKDYKLKNDNAPLEYVEKSIKDLILNQRKIEFLKNIENNVYVEGLRKNKFKIYNLKSNETD